MTLTIPHAISRYLQSQGKDGASGLAGCFSADAEVRDEGHTYQGLPAIMEWKQATDAKYEARLTPLGLSQQGECFKLLVHVEGNFPGKRVELMHVFTVREGLIAALEIRDPVELEGRRALVTGGTKGIGAAVVAQLTRAGATVLTAARSLPVQAYDHAARNGGPRDRCRRSRHLHPDADAAARGDHRLRRGQGRAVDL